LAEKARNDSSPYHNDEKEGGGNNNNVSAKLRYVLPEIYTVTFPDEPLRVAADKMSQAQYSGLPVVDPSNPQRVVGLISSDDLFAARKLWSAEERTLEKVLTVPIPFTKGVSTERLVRVVQRSKGN
jgi:predicted transcriptional regulator